MALLLLDVRLQFAFDGLEEARDVVAYFEGFAAVQIYLHEAGATDEDIRKTVAVFRMLPKDCWKPVAKPFMPFRGCGHALLNLPRKTREEFPPSIPLGTNLELLGAEMPTFELANLAAEPVEPAGNNPEVAGWLSTAVKLEDKEAEANEAHT